jgi:ribonuclease VapC
MVIDTSALVAILNGEPERRSFLDRIEDADSCLMSLASFVEISMVIEARHGAEGVRDLDHLIARARIELIAVDYDQGQIARSAFSRFGKGRHPGRAELRRLLFLRACHSNERAAAVQGK